MALRDGELGPGHDPLVTNGRGKTLRVDTLGAALEKARRREGAEGLVPRREETIRKLPEIVPTPVPPGPASEKPFRTVPDLTEIEVPVPLPLQEVAPTGPVGRRSNRLWIGSVGLIALIGGVAFWLLRGVEPEVVLPVPVASQVNDGGDSAVVATVAAIATPANVAPQQEAPTAIAQAPLPISPVSGQFAGYAALFGSEPETQLSIGSPPKILSFVGGVTPNLPEISSLAAIVPPQVALPVPEALPEVAVNAGRPAGVNRIAFHYTEGLDSAVVEAFVGRLAAQGIIPDKVTAVPFEISRTNTRFFEAEIADAAGQLATMLGDDGLVRDFTHYRPSPAPGFVEIWLSSSARITP